MRKDTGIYTYTWPCDSTEDPVRSMMEMCGFSGPRTALFGRRKAELGALVRNDSPKDGLYSDRESFALASLVLYIQPFENRCVRLLVSYIFDSHGENLSVKGIQLDK